MSEAPTSPITWGEVRVCEPPHRVVHTFALAQDPEHPSEVAVEFVSE